MKPFPSPARRRERQRAVRPFALAVTALALAAFAAPAPAAETAASPRPEPGEKTDKTGKPEKPEKVAKPERTEKAERRRDREPTVSAPLPTSRPALPPARSSSRSAAGPAAPVAATVAPAGSFESFGLIAERNIFNPQRIGRTRANPDAPSPRTDQIALVGTVERGSSLVAVFDSTEPAWRKSLAVGESVGDFKVVRITSAGADLERDGQPVSLLVSHALRRPEGGEWSIAKPPADVPPSGGLIGPRPGDTSAAPAEIPANASEVLKRLMKQREQQLKK